DYRYVPLGTTRQPVGNIDQLLVTDDRIIVVDKERAQTVFIFDLDGNPCAEIYRLGRGPQEYYHIDHVTLTPGEKPQLAILDGRGNKVLFYDLDGRFVNSTPISFRFTGMEYLDKNEILCFTDAYVRHDPSSKERKVADRLLFFTDNKFQIKACALTNRAVNRKIGFTEPIVKQSGDDLLINPKLNDTIYRLDGRSLKPLYYVDKSALGSVLPTEDLTDEQIIELDKKAPVFWGSFTPGEKFLFLEASTPPAEIIDIYCHSKTSGKIYLLKNNAPRSGDAALADVAFCGVKSSWKDQFIAQIPAYVVPLVYQRDGTDNPVLKDIGEDANPVLIFYTLKEPDL
ncbi:MAG TPA: 6-bladed beta-propeller, partial [Alistipes onderdonkii]